SVAGGETIVVTRAGRRVALITPGSHANGDALREILEHWRYNPALDDAFAREMVAARDTASSESDTDPRRSAAQRAFLDDVLRVLPVHDYDRNVADHHASLLAHVRRTGSKRGAHDLIIAATARAANRIVVTTDKRAGFDELPDVTARIITA